MQYTIGYVMNGTKDLKEAFVVEAYGPVDAIKQFDKHLASLSEKTPGHEVVSVVKSRKMIVCN